MPNKCWAPGCKSNYYTTDPHIPVFKSPEDTGIRQAWLNALHREHDNPPRLFHVCIKHFQETDIELTIKVNDGIEITHINRERPILRKGAIPSILPGCPTYLTSTKSTRAFRFSHGAKEEELFTIARKLSLETQVAEGNKFQVSSFSDMKDKLPSSYPDPWLVWFSQDNTILNFLYPSKSEKGIDITASLIIDSTMSVRAFLRSKVISLKRSSINDFRQIEPLLNDLESQIISSNMTTKPRNLITDAIALLQNALSVIEEQSDENEDQHCDNSLLSSLQFIICQLQKLCVPKSRRRYNILTQIVALNAHLISRTCYSFLQSLDCMALPHFNTIQNLYSSFGIDDEYTNFLQQATAAFSTQQWNGILQMDEIHIKPDLTYKAGKIIGGSLDPSDPTRTVFAIMVSSLFKKWSTIIRLLPLGTSSATQLLSTIKSVISDVERCNLSVQVINTDAYPLNVNLFKMLSPDNTLQPMVPHPFDPSRCLFLIFDFVHIMKSIRNNWLNVKNHDKTLQYPDFEDFQQVNNASFEDIRILYREEQYKCVKLAPILIAKSCWPTSLERQKVDLALRVFCDSTRSAIQIKNEGRIEKYQNQTSDFLTVIIQLWKLFNVNRPNKDIRLNDYFCRQFCYNDDRFSFLAKIVDWIYAWKALPGKDGKLSHQTFTSLKHSCLALPKIVNHLTKECGFTYFLSYFLQTDALEHHFGVYRMMSGANYHISYCQVLESEPRLKVSTILNIFSNQQSNLTLAEFIKSFSAPPDETDNDTSVDISLYFPAISNLSDIYIDTHTLQSLSFIGGYTVHQLCKHLSPCRDCMDFLTVDKFLYPEDSDSKYKIFEFIDRGNLKWPSDVVLDAVIITWKIFMIIEQNDELLNRFIAGSSRNTLVHLSFSTIEYQEVNIGEIHV